MMPTERDSSRSLVLLAPGGARVPDVFGRVDTSHSVYSDLMSRVQRLRGRIMVEEQALPERELDSLGRHRSKYDYKAWHMVTLSGAGEVVGCFRYLVHPTEVSFGDLSIKRVSKVMGCSRWASQFRAAIESELARVRRFGFQLVEFGGWVLSQEFRGSTEAFRMALNAYAWTQLAGGCLGLTTATVKNGSASMLRRLGGSSLEAFGEPIPRYFDSEYNCDIEMLRFDSRTPNPEYDGRLAAAREKLSSATVVCSRRFGQLPLAS